MSASVPGAPGFQFEVDWRMQQPLSGSFWMDTDQDPRKLDEQVTRAICEYISEVRERTPHLIEVRRADTPEPWRGLSPDRHVNFAQHKKINETNADVLAEPRVPDSEEQRDRLALLLRGSGVSEAGADALVSTAVARQWTQQVVGFQREMKDDPLYRGDPSLTPAIGASVYLVVGVMPMPPMGLAPGFTEQDVLDVAMCLAYVGYEQRAVYEAWPTFEQAAERCLALAVEKPLRLALIVECYRLGHQVQSEDDRHRRALGGRR